MKGDKRVLIALLVIVQAFTVFRPVSGIERNEDNLDEFQGNYNNSVVVTENIGLDDDSSVTVVTNVGFVDDTSSDTETGRVGLDFDFDNSSDTLTTNIGLDDNSSLLVTENVGLDDVYSSVSVTANVELDDNSSVTATKMVELNDNDPNIVTESVGLNEDAFVACKHMLNALPPLIYNSQLSYYAGLQGQKMVEGWSTASGYSIHHVMRFHAIGPVYEEPDTTYVCAGMNDASSYTYLDKPSSGGRPIAWITSHTRSQIAIGVVKLKTQCWRNNKSFYGCSPVFYPRPFMYNLRQFKLSPLDELFWSNFSSTQMEIPLNWIWKINIQINATSPSINIPPKWIYNMNIPNLTEFYIKGNNWKEPDNILPYSPSLLYLSLSNNSLLYLPKDVINNVPALVILDLSYNKIVIFPDGIEVLKHLRCLDVSHSQSLIPLYLLEENLQSLPRSLEILKLEETALTVDFDNFLLLPVLEYLNISGCSLDGFPLDTAPNLGHSRGQNYSTLTVIDFSNNIISSLTSNTFRKLTLLEKLNLSRNDIGYIEDDTFQNNLFLIIINLSHNNIQFIPNCLFCTLSRLEQVDLSHNQLKELPYFDNVKLLYLGLTYNTLNEFQLNSSFIDYVDLSHNNVSKLQISLVKTLNLSYNSLSFISIEMWHNINRLQVIDLGGNDFQCCLVLDTLRIKNYNTLILNLGTSKPVTCIDKGTSNLVISNITFELNSCQNDSGPTPVGMYFVIALAVVFVIAIIVVILVLAYIHVRSCFSRAHSQKWYLAKTI